ncbi:MAG: hypothetical protein V1494_01890 [Candidatus Diapherotrites archaeon]
MKGKVLAAILLLATVLVLLSGCPEKKSECGNGICEKDETEISCAADCSFADMNLGKACIASMECDDGDDATEDSCEGSPKRCVNRLKTCSELGREICGANYTCSGYFVRAADSNRCCSEECVPGVGCTNDSDCDDNNSATNDSCTGTPKKCTHTELAGCVNRDGVCGFGCTFSNDNDCQLTQMPCTDSDGGKEHYVFGKSNGRYSAESDNSRGTEDYCVNNVLHEFYCRDCLEISDDKTYCRGGYLAEEIFTCPNSCDKGVCFGPEFNPPCEETDGGKNFAVTGSTTGKFSDFQQVKTYTDDCTSSGLREYFCDENGFIKVHFFDCGSGKCSGGMCTSNPAENSNCIDSDGGKDYYIKGVSSGTMANGSVYQSGQAYDTCIDQSRLSEWHCDGGYLAKENYACPYGCVDGACVQNTNSTCTDSDGGKDYSTKGYINGKASTGTQVTSYDQCTGGNLLEWFCNASGFADQQINLCPNDCSDGACVNYSTVPCTDSDGGRDYNVFGSSSGKIRGDGTVSSYDQCNGNTLAEWYCDAQGFIVQDNYNCPFGCSSGTCKSGQTKTFNLVVTSTTSNNLIAISLENTGYSTASQLCAGIKGCESVGKWVAVNQNYTYYTTGLPSSDFPLVVGNGYMISVTEPSTFMLRGTIPESIKFNLITTPITNVNLISLPYGMPEITTASGLGNSITGCDLVSKWVAESQSYFSHVPNVPINNFSVEPGNPYFVGVTNNSTWPA